MEIPKIVHYCWFGRMPLPPLAEKCIASWRKYLPDYEIRRWDEDNFDIGVIPYTQRAYELGKYAFVSDYARFWILYRFGGLYFDTDVEIIRSIDDLLACGPYMGAEDDGNTWTRTYNVNTGIGMAVNKGNPFVKDILDAYSRLSFEYIADIRKMPNVVGIVSKRLLELGLQNKCEIQNVAGFKIYTHDYFSPINTISMRLHVTDNTRSIHWFAGSWTERHSWKNRIRQLLPETFILFLSKMKWKIRSLKA